MKVQFVETLPELKQHIQAAWILDCPTGIPSGCCKTVAAPNGCPKLVIPVKNTLTSLRRNIVGQTRRDQLYFDGLQQFPIEIRTTPQETQFICVEFYPHAAHDLFGVPMSELVNRCVTIDDVIPKWGMATKGLVCDESTASGKLHRAQEQLIALLRRSERRNSVVAFCVESIRRRSGLVPIRELERETGYSRRYLEILFRQHLGIPPKVLAGIYRFQKFFGKLAQGNSYEELREDIYDHYYDQAHFSKEFKKMTGFSPRDFSNFASQDVDRQVTNVTQGPH